MGQKEYAECEKAHACHGGLDCCGTSYGHRKSKAGNCKPLTRRHLRRVKKHKLKKEIE